MIEYQSLLFVIVIAVIASLRIRKIIAGGKVSKNRIILTMVFYFTTSALAVFSSFQIGVSLWFLFAYAAALIGTIYLSNKWISGKITVWKADDGTIFAKGGNIVYVVWLVGLLLRFAIGYVFIGPNYLNIYEIQQHIMDSSAIMTITIVDIIMMIGVGTMTGRNIRLLSKLRNLSPK